jgi:uncharacterized protein (TIGR02996 family)
MHVMTHEEAFIRAIRETPDDDAPRLIYADWLEEHGQADRAEFIRIQCQFARLLVTGPKPDMGGLLSRTVDLLREHWSEWVGPLRAIVGPWGDRYGERWMVEEYHFDGLHRFQRGFVDSLSLDTEDYLRNVEELRRLTPLRELRLWGAGRCARRLAKEPELAGLSVLSFTDYYSAPLTAKDMAALAKSPYLDRLTALYLGGNSLGDDGVEALARTPWLSHVTVLDLSDNGLSSRALRALADSPNLLHLQKLFLQNNCFSEEEINALRKSPNLPSLKHLEYYRLPRARSHVGRSVYLLGGSERP